MTVWRMSGCVVLLGAWVACGTDYRDDTPAADAGTSTSSSTSGGGSSSTSSSSSSSSGGSSSTSSSGDSGTSSGGPPKIGCNGEPACARYVFVTSKQYTAKMRGPEGADQRCQLLADGTSGPLHGRTFRAWLGDQLNPANARHPHGTQPYRMVDGTVIATDWADLTDGSLEAGISLTETATMATGGAWTATNAQGEGMSQDCDEWDTTGGTGGVYGKIGARDETWTNSGGIFGCASELAIYCFEY